MFTAASRSASRSDRVGRNSPPGRGPVGYQHAPGVDGITATKRIVETQPAARIVILTALDLDEYAFSALRAGASGFLLKDAGPPQLCGEVRAGDASISPRVTRRRLELFADKAPNDTTPGPDGGCPQPEGG